jgi:hypothetical protein
MNKATLARKIFGALWGVVFLGGLWGGLRPNVISLAVLSILPLLSILVLYPVPRLEALWDYKVAFLLSLFFWSLNRALIAVIYRAQFPWTYGTSAYWFTFWALSLTSLMPWLLQGGDRRKLETLRSPEKETLSSVQRKIRLLVICLGVLLAAVLAAAPVTSVAYFVASNVLQGLYLVLISLAWALKKSEKLSLKSIFFFWLFAVFPALFGVANRTALLIPTVYVVLVCCHQWASARRLSAKTFFVFGVWIVVALGAGTLQKIFNVNLVKLPTSAVNTAFPAFREIVSILQKKPASWPAQPPATPPLPLVGTARPPAPTPGPEAGAPKENVSRFDRLRMALKILDQNIKSIYLEPKRVDDYYFTLQRILEYRYFTVGGLLYQDGLMVAPRRYFPNKPETNLTMKAFHVGLIRNFLYEELFLEPLLDSGLGGVVFYHLLWLLLIRGLLFISAANKNFLMGTFCRNTYLLGCLILFYGLRGPQIILIQYLAVPVLCIAVLKILATFLPSLPWAEKDRA